MLISVIIATYDRPKALVAVLNGLRRQTDTDFEILIADDGSDSKTSDAIHPMHGKLGVPIQRIWQPHRDFRAAAIRNRAIWQARGEYVVFLDGDCVPRPEFIARHRKLAEPGYFVFGQRALLSEEYTRHILTNHIDLSAKSIPSLIASRMRGRINRFLPFMNVPLGPLRKLPWNGWQRLRGCNFGAWREDLIRIDGFDSAYTGWGLEDSDLAVRLANSGVRAKDGRLSTGVMHLWHPAIDRAAMTDNLKRLQKAIANGAIRAEKGISTMTRLATPPPASNTGTPDAGETDTGSGDDGHNTGSE